MSTIDSGDLEATGYFLPEDGWLRLKKLREYVALLANLARPRTSDERTAAIRVGDVAICLELLEEQIGRVLDELSGPAERGERAAVRQVAAEAAEPEVAEPVPGEASDRYPFGVTLAQIDEINLLLDMIRAHGDVVIASDDAEFADHTLSQIGHAIFCDAEKLRGVIHDVNAQWLDPAYGTRTGVRDERAVYHVLPARFVHGGASHVVRQLPTYQ